MASGAVGISAAATRKRLAGRWVNTMVRMSPKRPASRAEISCDPAATSPVAKNTFPVVATDSPKRWCSHSTISDCTTSPLAAESSENSAASRSTTGRDRTSGGVARPGSVCSTAGDSDR